MKVLKNRGVLDRPRGDPNSRKIGEGPAGSCYGGRDWEGTGVEGPAPLDSQDGRTEGGTRTLSKPVDPGGVGGYRRQYSLPFLRIYVSISFVSYFRIFQPASACVSQKVPW